MPSARRADPFLAQLAELVRSARTRAQWVLVPSRALGHPPGERLALDGTAWANLRFVTPLDLALEVAAPSLVERGLELPDNRSSSSHRIARIDATSVWRSSSRRGVNRRNARFAARTTQSENALDVVRCPILGRCAISQ